MCEGTANVEDVTRCIEIITEGVPNTDALLEEFCQ